MPKTKQAVLLWAIAPAAQATRMDRDRKARAARSSSFDETNEETSLWRQICQDLTKLDSIHQEGDNIFGDINRHHKAADSDEGVSSSISAKLVDLYERGIKTSNSETETIKEATEKIKILIALRNAPESGDQKRKKRKSEAEDLRSGAVSASGSGILKKSKSSQSGLIKIGATVAAKHGKQKDKASEEWIQAVVLNYYPDKNKYQVEDADEAADGTRPRYTVPAKNIIPIPDESDVRLMPEIPISQDVLALYPGTTCFYKATVVMVPSKNKDSDHPGYYKLRFEDDNNDTKFVSPKEVLKVK